jgi:hypothetical protein
MPLTIRGKSYPAPNEDNQPGVLGKELVAIEDHFGLDAITLLSTLESADPSTFPGYTKAKAMYAFAWICLTRAGEILSINDVLNDYSLDELIEVEESEIKKEVTSLFEEEQKQESEAISLS